jgi:hypothetical protein
MKLNYPILLKTFSGQFYPRAYVSAMFAQKASVLQVRQSLLQGGYDESEIVIFPASEIMAQISADQALPPAEGVDASVLRRYQALALDGHCGLMVFAYTDDETERIMKVIGRGEYGCAYKYLRFFIEDLTP